MPNRTHVVCFQVVNDEFKRRNKNSLNIEEKDRVII